MSQSSDLLPLVACEGEGECEHLTALAQRGSLTPPRLSTKVYKEECVLCFHTQDDGDGVNVCLHCFEGFCPAHSVAHHVKYPDHLVALNVTRTMRTSAAAPAKLVRLEIPVAATEEYDHQYRLHCFSCNRSVDATVTRTVADTFPTLQKVVEGVSDATEASAKTAAQEGDAWTEPAIQPCKHTQSVAEDIAEDTEETKSTKDTEDTEETKSTKDTEDMKSTEDNITHTHTHTHTHNRTHTACAKCDLKNNLWKCLECGALGCGRRQFDGSGGEGHAQDHYRATGHGLAVKLGTIVVREGEEVEGDVYCYDCDDLVRDPLLTTRLAAVGIDAAQTRKTEKSLAELQLAVNLTHSYAMTDGAGEALRTLRGPWRRGFSNLGNSCYMATVLQSLRNLDRDGFLAATHDYVSCSVARAGECLECQLRKLHGGLGATGECAPLRPWMFKTVAAGTHPEFSSARQQDASEFMAHLLQSRFRRVARLVPLADSFAFTEEQQLECEGGCGMTRTSSTVAHALTLTVGGDDGATPPVVSLEDLMHGHFATETVELRCDRCGHSRARKRLHLSQLPRHLIVVVNRFQLRNWIPEKTACQIVVPEAGLSLLPFTGGSSVTAAIAVTAVTADPVLLGELLLLGIEEEAARRALIASNNASIDAAMMALFDPPASGIDAGHLETLMAAGFAQEHATRALQATNGDLERAFDWIFSHGDEVASEPAEQKLNAPLDARYTLSSFITHKGQSVHCGHYVAHLRQEESEGGESRGESSHSSSHGWVLYNDDLVAEATRDASFPIKDAYIYIYTVEQS